MAGLRGRNLSPTVEDDPKEEICKKTSLSSPITHSEEEHFSSATDSASATSTHTSPPPSSPTSDSAKERSERLDGAYTHDDGKSFLMDDDGNISHISGSDDVKGISKLKEYEEAAAADKANSKSKNIRKQDIEMIKERIEKLEREMEEQKKRQQKEKKKAKEKSVESFMLSSFMSQKSYKGWLGKLEAAEAQGRKFIRSETGGYKDSDDEDSIECDGEEDFPSSPIKTDIRIMKKHILYQINEREYGGPFKNISANAKKNKRMLKRGGFMMIMHMVFRGGFIRPRKAGSNTKFIFTRWGLFEMKVRPFLVENFDETVQDMRGYFCYGHGGKEWEELSRTTGEKRVRLVRNETVRDRRMLRDHEIRVVKYKGRGPAYASRVQTSVDLGTPMCAGSGYVLGRDRPLFVDAVREFQEKDHRAFANAEIGQECVQLMFEEEDDDEDPDDMDVSFTPFATDQQSHSVDAPVHKAQQDGGDKTAANDKRKREDDDARENTAKKIRRSSPDGSLSDEDDSSSPFDPQNGEDEEVDVESGATNQDWGMTAITRDGFTINDTAEDDLLKADMDEVDED